MLWPSMPAILKISYSPHFERSARSLQPNQLKLLSDRIEIFKLNCFDPRLKIHKLRGKHKNFWSFSISAKERVMFEFVGKGVANLVDFGDHSIYR